MRAVPDAGERPPLAVVEQSLPDGGVDDDVAVGVDPTLLLTQAETCKGYRLPPQVLATVSML
jgi:hypothetical protein